ncbi:MAG TPA: NAD(P)-dependent methylenetetrahydromethanopterin dehydrogenase [Burkholderiaceae bacterium]|nr:NAD(P)-dependent methylenetetrahydromethanopterin dehydrogenase [Burkholderiaceae bacterium]
MERPYILHLFTPARQASPFDVNMAADAGYQLVVPYAEVALPGVMGLTQDAIFSRGPKGVARTGIFIGGRDAVLATEMLDAARKAMVPPFEISVMADPSGAYTTAAAMVAAVERQLRRAHHTTLSGRRVLILGGTGPVGRVAAVMAARAGAAEVVLSSHRGPALAEEAAEEMQQRFGVSGLRGVGAQDPLAVREALREADVVLGTAAAGVQVMSADDRRAAPRLLVAADVNAVPPEGLAGVGVMDDGRALEGTQAVGIGALAIGDIKYQTQHRLLLRMRLREGGRALYLGVVEAFEMAREVAAEADAAKA